MESFAVIFNDVPLPRPNHYCEQIYLPKQVVFEAENMVDLYDQVYSYIERTNMRFSSFEVDLI